VANIELGRQPNRRKRCRRNRERLGVGVRTTRPDELDTGLKDFALGQRPSAATRDAVDCPLVTKPQRTRNIGKPGRRDPRHLRRKIRPERHDVARAGFDETKRRRAGIGAQAALQDIGALEYRGDQTLVPPRRERIEQALGDHPTARRRAR
jgi:hypothetical protein